MKLIIPTLNGRKQYLQSFIDRPIKSKRQTYKQIKQTAERRKRDARLLKALS